MNTFIVERPSGQIIVRADGREIYRASSSTIIQLSTEEGMVLAKLADLDDVHIVGYATDLPVFRLHN